MFYQPYLGHLGNAITEAVPDWRVCQELLQLARFWGLRFSKLDSKAQAGFEQISLQEAAPGITLISHRLIGYPLWLDL